MANNSKVALLCAYTLAKAKRYADAEALLLSDHALTKTVEALDLLARIHAERGELAEARRIWQEIQTVHPEHEPSRRALANLGKAPRKNLWKGLTFAALIVGLLVGVLLGRMCTSAPAEAPEEEPPEPVPTVMKPGAIRWNGIPNSEQFALLQAYRGTVSRVLVSTDFFAEPKRVAHRAILAEMLGEALGIPKGAVFIGGGAPGESPETLLLELE